MTSNKSSTNTRASGAKPIQSGAKDEQAEADSNNTDAPTISVGLFSMKNFNCDRDLPIVYSPNYDIYLFGVELLHQFDSKKYTKIADHLSTNFLDTQWARHLLIEEADDSANSENPVNPRRLRFMKPNRAISLEELTHHHDVNYINQLHEDKSIAARILEIWAINLLPISALESRLFQPLRLQVSGSIFAAHLAIQNGWSVNLGGGFHQASAGRGETFCIFSDVCLIMKYLWRKHPLQKFMVIDLDAHQATGIERDLANFSEKKRRMVYMMDMFNNGIQPPDPSADKGIDLKIELGPFTGDDTYLKRLDSGLSEAFRCFKPTLIIYIAGQDILKDDQLGLMNLTEGGLLRRDELVFSYATQKHKYPIVMLLGGGFSARGPKLIADSIKNLYSKGLIWGGHRSGERSLSRPHRKIGSHSSGSAGKTNFKNLTPAHQTEIKSNPKSSFNHKKLTEYHATKNTPLSSTKVANKTPAQKSHHPATKNAHLAKKSA